MTYLYGQPLSWGMVYFALTVLVLNNFVWRVVDDRLSKAYTQKAQLPVTFIELGALILLSLAHILDTTTLVIVTVVLGFALLGVLLLKLNRQKAKSRKSAKPAPDQKSRKSTTEATNRCSNQPGPVH